MSRVFLVLTVTQLTEENYSISATYKRFDLVFMISFIPFIYLKLTY